MRAAGHVIFWITFVSLGIICCVRASFRYGETGYDDDGSTRDRYKFNILRVWITIGIGLIIFPLIDMLSFFDLMPR
jgi:hypothetical protein